MEMVPNHHVDRHDKIITEIVEPKLRIEPVIEQMTVVQIMQIMQIIKKVPIMISAMAVKMIIIEAVDPIQRITFHSVSPFHKVLY
jgi:hypothetical protein